MTRLAFLAQRQHVYWQLLRASLVHNMTKVTVLEKLGNDIEGMAVKKFHELIFIVTEV